MQFLMMSERALKASPTATEQFAGALAATATLKSPSPVFLQPDLVVEIKNI